MKQQTIGIVDARLGTNQEPTRYLLAPFNDPVVGPVLTTVDADVFKAQINALPAVGGGDCPEPVMTGVLQAVLELDRGGDVFVFTDASAKDPLLATTVTALANRKDIAIYPFVFGSCSPIDPVYFQAAQATGGQAFVLSVEDAGTITKLVDFLVRNNTVHILHATVELAGEPQTFEVPVDSGMTHLTVSASGTDDVEITRPDGAVVAPDDPEVELVSLSSESAPATIMAIGSPDPGIWTVTLDGTGEVSLVVSGESDLDLARFGFLQEAEHHGLAGLSPIPGLPVAGREAVAHAVLTEGFETAQFELRTVGGALLQPIGLTAAVDNEFTGDLTPPDVPFRVYVTGVDASGAPYQRLLPAPVLAQPLLVTPPPPSGLRLGATTSYTFEVENTGPADSFAVSAVDDGGFVQSITPQALELGAGETGLVTVTLEPTDDAPAYAANRLVVDVASTTRPEVHNFAAVTDSIVAPEDDSDGGSGGEGRLPVTGGGAQVAMVGGLLIALGTLFVLAGRRTRRHRRA